MSDIIIYDTYILSSTGGGGDQEGTGTKTITTDPAILGFVFVGQNISDDVTMGVVEPGGNQGTKLVTQQYDATQKSLSGFHGGKGAINCDGGIAVTITCSGAFEIEIGYKLKKNLNCLLT